MTNIYSEVLDDGVFLLNCGDDYIALSPKRKKSFLVLKKGVDALRDYYGGAKNPIVEEFLRRSGFLGEIANSHYPTEEEGYHPTAVTFALNSGCNLRCVYCYSSANKQSEIMKIDIAKSAVDIMVQNAKRSGRKKISITYHGGGEILIVWHLMKQISEYAETQWNGEILFSIVTNGTLITSEIADWMSKRNFHVLVSIDGPEEIQNQQRPKANGKGSFNDCMRGILLLKEKGISHALRTTVTRDNIDLLLRMVDLAAQTNSNLKLEPVSLIGRGVNLQVLSGEEFVSKYIEAFEYGEKIGVDVRSSYDNILLRDNFCAGNGYMFCVLPNGMITSCTRITKSEDELAERFIIGQVLQADLEVNSAKIEWLRQLKIVNFSQCKDCFAKDFCSGGCYHSRLSNSDRLSNEDCLVIKQLVWYRLRKNIMKGGE